MKGISTIWALFSVENNYDQPPNNLVAWWPTKPDLDELSKALGRMWPPKEDAAIISIVGLHVGETIKLDDTAYRLRQIEEGVGKDYGWGS